MGPDIALGFGRAKVLRSVMASRVHRGHWLLSRPPASYRRGALGTRGREFGAGCCRPLPVSVSVSAAATGYGLPVAGGLLPVAGCGLRVAGCGLRVAGCALRVARCPLPVAARPAPKAKTPHAPNT